MPVHDSKDGFEALRQRVHDRVQLQEPHVQGTFVKKFNIVSESSCGRWLQVRVTYWSSVEPACQLIPMRHASNEHSVTPLADWFWLETNPEVDNAEIVNDADLDTLD